MAGGLSSLSSIPTILVIRWISAMYSVPFLKATPLGRLRPLAMTLTSRCPPLSTTAYTLLATRLLTKRVPLSPQVIARALLIPCAQSETLKPGGTLILSTGISPGALGAGGWAIGASGESAMLGGWPCFQVGGGCGGCWASANGPRANTRARAITTEVRMMRSMRGLPFEERVGE